MTLGHAGPCAGWPRASNLTSLEPQLCHLCSGSHGIPLSLSVGGQVKWNQEPANTNLMATEDVTNPVPQAQSRVQPARRGWYWEAGAVPGFWMAVERGLRKDLSGKLCLLLNLKFKFTLALPAGDLCKA